MSYQNTITNADKLLSAADELAHTGECDPKEIYQEAQDLQQRMGNFLTALERRKATIQMAVDFYTHVHEVGRMFGIQRVYKEVTLQTCQEVICMIQVQFRFVLIMKIDTFFFEF